MIFTLLLPTKVFGASYSGDIETNTDKIKPGEEIEVNFYLQNYENIKDGINAYKATLEYDKNIFEEVELENFESKNLWQEFLYNKDSGEFIAIKKAGSKQE